MTRFAALAALAAVLVLSLAAPRAEAQAGVGLDAPTSPLPAPALEPAKPSVESASGARTRADHGLVAAGATLLIGAYSANLGGSFLWSLTHLFNGGTDTGAYLLSAAVPVVGPFLQLGWSTADFERVLLVGSGALQAVGAALLVAGLATRHPVEPGVDLGEGRSLRVTPTAGLHGAGVSVTLAGLSL
jgi:hypothetical protein